MRVYGSIQGVDPGTWFEDRRALHEAGVHRPLQAGICGSAAEGAESIVMSGGYEDDEDHGDVIIYTGHGGNDTETGQQIADQELTRQNLALARNAMDGTPVRVIRGSGHNSLFAPARGYRYDGLFEVQEYWQERGRSGFMVWRYRLVKR
ncbi:MAG: YDG/SRA domain-containing protein [Armatimonadia bacterium]